MVLKRLSYIIIFSIVCAFYLGAQTWQNPLELENEWSLYSIGDPYLLKFNGTYYLYVSTRDDKTGVKTWSSKDLVNWNYEGLCATDPITKGAYAPEVIYWGGEFYMYTSPGGNGHYILKSSSPTGPFEVVSTNLGHSIDGSVFIEDDGTLYFYHSGNDGIHAHTMNSPTSIGSDIILSPTRMNGWTEGPAVIKRKGRYYMIYTGNHVISKGYRIDLAMSEVGPTSNFVPSRAQNPVIVRTEGSHVGLGHGSMFIGPNLDEYFITYHNLAGDFGHGPFRHLNFDKIGFNGDKLMVFGPTNSVQQAPEMPLFYDFFERTEIGEQWITSQNGTWNIADSTSLVLEVNSSNEDSIYFAIVNHDPANIYTAEFNVKEYSTDSELIAGALFNYQDELNYCSAILNKDKNTLEVNSVSNGVHTNILSADLSGVDNYMNWNCIRIEKDDSAYSFFVNGMMKLQTDQLESSGKIGYVSINNSAKYGHIAYSNKVNGSSIFSVSKPLPGTIAAVHYNAGQNLGYFDNTPGNDFATSFRNDSVDVVENDLGGYSVVGSNGEWLTYNVMVKDTRKYSLGLNYATGTENSQIRIWQGDKEITEIIALPSTGSDQEYSVFNIKDIPLEQGPQTIKLEIVTGDIRIYEYKFVEYDELLNNIEDPFDSRFIYAWNYDDGNWSIENDLAKGTETSKRTIGSENLTDYSVSVDIKYTDNFSGGLIFRVKNPALGGAGDNADLGADFFQGYDVSLRSNGVILTKHNFSNKALKFVQGAYELGVWYKMAVVVKGNNIKVFIDDFSNPVIDYIDNDHFISGKAGIRTYRSTVYFDNFKISSEAPTGLQSHVNTDDFLIYPNPASEYLFIRTGLNIDEPVHFELINNFGKLLNVRDLSDSAREHEISLKNIAPGSYIVRLKGANFSVVNKLIVQ